MSARQDQAKFHEAMKRLVADPQPVHFNMAKHEAFMLVSIIQLAVRHPNPKGPLREFAEAFGKGLGRGISTNDRDLRLMIEMGWNQQNDVTAPESSS